MAREFAKALKEPMQNKDGYVESTHYIVTWCVGHLITMSYPEKYDMKYKRWSMDTLPFLPATFKYEVISSVKKQYDIVSGLLTSPEVGTIFVCTDSGREGEYIYRLVDMMAGVKDKKRKRVWIDSQTEEEIIRGIKEAKDISAYDNLSASAFLRAKEDYLMGINFSRVLSLRYSNAVTNYLGGKYQAISVGRVMTCVLGMVVRREREIRAFTKTPFYRVLGHAELAAGEAGAASTAAGRPKHAFTFAAEWRAAEGSRYYQSPLLYKENGFKEKKDAQVLIDEVLLNPPKQAVVSRITRKKENKNPPLLFNLAELQNVCSRLFKISPDQTLQVVQELYEKKLVTYPRTDARVLSSAVAKEIHKNIGGLRNYKILAKEAGEVLQGTSYKQIAKTRYVNDKQITDHYAIIPTGQGMNNLSRLSELSYKIYEVIARRFIGIFYPPAVYQKVNLELTKDGEHLFANFKVLLEDGYQKTTAYSFAGGTAVSTDDAKGEEEDNETESLDAELMKRVSMLKKGSVLPMEKFEIKEGETSPPKRYTSGSMILAMENAGSLIEDEELRAQIKGSGIGTSATRAEILKKLVTIKYLSIVKKTQVITPTLMGEMIFDVVDSSIRSLLNPALTASWEKGLTYVAEGSITEGEYMEKLERFVTNHTHQVMHTSAQSMLRAKFDHASAFYKKQTGTAGDAKSRQAKAAGTAGDAPDDKEKKAKPANRSGMTSKENQTGSGAAREKAGTVPSKS